ncbi:Hypothetical predicted protein [Pelobates cultripes]|uniref:exodeoxyribonuclease III n=1 Tax=Pelobates cultripes TaxID=61616 RepID=A0AAD1RI42_PELCU|nr:Hypothetical predicted protein [Pelobates cultripes]
MTSRGREGFAPAPLRIWSNNVRGLNLPERRSHLLRALWSNRISVAFIQETHFPGQTGPALRDRRFPTGYFANHREAKKAGVAILFAAHVPFVCAEIKADPLGRYIFLKGSIADRRYTFASIYAPNTRQHSFLTRTLKSLEHFREGLLILTGDLNIPDGHLPGTVLAAGRKHQSGTIGTQNGWPCGLLESHAPRGQGFYILLPGAPRLQPLRLCLYCTRIPESITKM